MKKFLCTLAIVFALTTTFTACTDENVQPTTQEGGSGGGGHDPKGDDE
jgi:hypothetical protein